MHRAGEAWVEAVDGAQHFEWLLGVVDGVAGERRLVGAGLAVGVARAGVPGARHDALVVGDLLVVDDDPVGEAAARRFHEADALRALRPR